MQNEQRRTERTRLSVFIIRSAFSSDCAAGSGNKDVTVKVLADTDHFMHVARTGGPRERSTKGRQQQFTADYFPTVANWLSSRVR
jgi:hypothetical protein